MARRAAGATSGSGFRAGASLQEALGTAMADGPVAEQLLRRLEVADGGLDSAELATQLGVEHQAVVGAVKSLQALGEVSQARDAGASPLHLHSSCQSCFIFYVALFCSL